MILNDKQSFDEAILSGILGFVAIFIALKDELLLINQNVFMILILVYLIASLCRIFSIILESKKLTDYCVHFCRLVLVPYTLWAIIRIIFSEIGLLSIGTIIATQVTAFVLFYILDKLYGLKIELSIKRIKDDSLNN